ncbi:hypothetical protein B0H12DRAFT_764679 [Mycena haematopus]|nr:hypothetical protein B0H12DRAFT_764679 [Mycena haematopus]
MSATLEELKSSPPTPYLYRKPLLSPSTLLQMSSPKLSSSPASSPNHVRFNPEPASPSSKGRPRRMSLPYPGVAQGSKGSGDRKHSFDLFWRLHSLSAVSDIIPVDAAESEARPSEDTKTEEPVPSGSRATPNKSRPHNYIVLGRKQQQALKLKGLIQGDN